MCYFAFVMVKVSVIIPCLNEQRYIEQCLRSILAAEFPADKMEVIVVDGNSTDSTVSIVQNLQDEFDNVKLLFNPDKIVPIAMNLGIDKALGDTIIRLDAHAKYPKNYITELVHWKNKLNAANVGALINTDCKSKNPKSQAIVRVLSHKLGVGNGLFRVGVDEVLEVDTVPFGCFDKSVLREVGGYDPRLIRNQDIELNKRIKNKGGKVFLIPTVKCTYFARETWSELFNNNYKNGLWNLKTVYLTHNFGSLSLRHFIPLCFILSLVLPVILSFFYQPFLLVSLASLLLYFLLVGFVSFSMDRRETSVFHLFFTFIVLHISYGLGSLIGLFHVTDVLKK